MPGHEPAVLTPIDKHNEASQTDLKLQDTSVWHGEGTMTPIDLNNSLMMQNNYNEASDVGENDEEEEEEV